MNSKIDAVNVTDEKYFFFTMDFSDMSDTYNYTTNLNLSMKWIFVY
jgi:hypothetical protein